LLCVLLLRVGALVYIIVLGGGEISSYEGTEDGLVRRGWNGKGVIVIEALISIAVLSRGGRQEEVEGWKGCFGRV
jgi:hypothetical protein